MIFTLTNCVHLCTFQLAQLRTLFIHSEEEEMEHKEEEEPHPLVDNWRPVQPLNGRTVYRGNIAERPSVLSGNFIYGDKGPLYIHT